MPTPSPPLPMGAASADRSSVVHFEEEPFALDLPLLHATIRRWLPINPDNNELVRGNAETVQLYQQLKAHGFSCKLNRYVGRTELHSRHHSPQHSLQLTIIIHCQGMEFDALARNPMDRIEEYCSLREIAWEEGDEIDQALGVRMLENLVENATNSPNVGLYRSIEDALSQMQRHVIDTHTGAAQGSSKATGRL